MEAGADGERTRRAGLFGAALVELERALDWELLGRLHCWEGGEEFFAGPSVGLLRDAGLLFAGELGERLAAEPPAGEVGLYAGASLAELAPALCEALVLGREVCLFNLPGPEADELNRALGEAEGRVGAPLPRVTTAPRDEVLAPLAGRVGHLWTTSVLTDPEAFPGLHDELYGRSGSASAGPGDPVRERREAEALVDALVATLAPPAWLVTTDEERPFFARSVHGRGWRLEVPEGGRLSAIVGDPVRIARVRLRGGGSSADALGPRRSRGSRTPRP